MIDSADLRGFSILRYHSRDFLNGTNPRMLGFVPVARDNESMSLLRFILESVSFGILQEINGSKPKPFTTTAVFPPRL